MKYSYADVLKITDDFLRYADGNCKMWLMGVWTIIEKNGLNKCCSDLERLRFYAVLYGACRIYSHFSDLISDTYFNDDIYLDIDYKKFSMLKDGDEEFEDVKQFISDVISEESNLYHVFDLLKTSMNSSRVFAALYYAYYYENYSLEAYENDEYYYGDITDPQELEEAKAENEDYELRKYYSTCDDETILDEILNDVDINKLSAFEWIDSYM